ncbi:lantibiotic immunity ABC transporter MutG family permease subunit [Clostridium sp. KNHs214]|uniref:lantibiotic immunity ABC transporter MutG family permease subunit n=1 Tax=Clostridium sp. KNHs214 TaxID=1540257 RepID=UPI00055656C5|nr:lantibiotic immunity ABC transporter MutG family permease subunit [Clostridium sp. KNHs214]
MKCFLKNLQSDIYKITHSALLPIHLILPIAGASVFLAYYIISPWEDAQKVSAYFQVLAMVSPLLIGVITAMLSEKELQAGLFQLVLSTPYKKCLPHFSMIFAILLFGFVASMIATVGFGFTFRIMGNRLFTMNLYVKAGLLLFYGNISLYILEYLLSFAFGKGIGLGVGIIGSLLSALLLTGLGDVIWPFLPWSIPTRFCSILVESTLAQVNFIGQSGVKPGFLFIVVSSAILLIIVKYWSTKWEGRKDEID